MSASLRYPIGRFSMPDPLSDATKQAWLDDIQFLPAHLRGAVEGLVDYQLDTPYRPGGWTVRQVVHHIADSHLNAYQRIKLALTEDEPLIRVYNEKAWAELPEAKTGKLELSLLMLDALHQRMSTVLSTLDAQDWERTFRHPEWGVHSVTFLLGMYAWHSRHHVAHITALRKRNTW